MKRDITLAFRYASRHLWQYLLGLLSLLLVDSIITVIPSKQMMETIYIPTILLIFIPLFSICILFPIRFLPVPHRRLTVSS